MALNAPVHYLFPLKSPLALKFLNTSIGLGEEIVTSRTGRLKNFLVKVVGKNDTASGSTGNRHGFSPTIFSLDQRCGHG